MNSPSLAKLAATYDLNRAVVLTGVGIVHLGPISTDDAAVYLLSVTGQDGEGEDSLGLVVHVDDVVELILDLFDAVIDVGEGARLESALVEKITSGRERDSGDGHH